MSGNYAGTFEYSTERLDSDYYFFGDYAYEISVLPNDDIKLEELDNYPCADFYLKAVKDYFSNITVYSQHCLELFKDDDCKLAKIIKATNCWLNDNDLKYINKFKQLDVYACDTSSRDVFSKSNNGKYNPEYIAVHNQFELDGGQTLLSMSLIFNVLYNPRTNTYSQQKINFYENEKEDIQTDNEEIQFDDYEKISEQKELDEMIESLDDEELVDLEKEETEDVYDPMLA